MKNTAKERERQWKKAYETVGSFLWDFANLEAHINEVFVKLYNFEQFSFISAIMIGFLDLRKKLELIELGLKHQGVDWTKLRKGMHRLHDIRNVLAHASYEPVDYGYMTDDARFQSPYLLEDGIHFDYVWRTGEMLLPWRKKRRKRN
jgi:hypothetical protein